MDATAPKARTGTRPRTERPAQDKPFAALAPRTQQRRGKRSPAVADAYADDPGRADD